MLVYADAKRSADPRALLHALLEHAATLAAQTGPRPNPSEQLTTLLLDAGELAQGLIDSEFQATEIDDSTPLVAAATALLREVAAAYVAPDHRTLTLAPSSLDEMLLPRRVTVSRPEGFAFYAVYPEAWARAAERFRGIRTRVVGIRSIGLTLGAVVAAAAGSEQFVSVRPTGHPFDRRLAIGSDLGPLLLADNRDVTYLVVDEGPGLSGSSFASVATWLTARGVPHDRVVFMPSHAGEPGPHASAAVRRIWAATQRLVPEAPRVLETFIDAHDLSGGQWRGEIYGQHPWPPANPQQERRKLLIREHGLPRLAKFAGLGRHGVEKLALAQTLAANGWIAQPLGLANGFITSEWLADALPLDHPAAVFDRAQLIGRVGDYIGFRGAALPAHDCPGASVDTLFQMLLNNAEEALGPDARAHLSSWERSLGELGTGLEPCRTDNRMHRFEWLTTPTGTIIKCDALDHHASHDLVGAQDPLWDLVGARHELALEGSEFSALTQRVARALGRSWTAAQIEFFSAAYLAFQCGAASLAADSAADADAILLRHAARQYARALGASSPW